MADFNMQGIDDLMSALNTLDTDRIAPTMLEEVVPILEENVKKGLQHIRLQEPLLNQ